MSLSICGTCLSRLRISSNAANTLSRAVLAAPQTSPFHSSATQFKSPLVKSKKGNAQSGGPVTRHRQSRSVRMKKKARDRPKLPPVGERRAQRRRIVLSNNNAFVVSDMPNWSKDNMLDEERVGQMMGLDGELLDQLRDSRAFKTTQNWSLFRRPATLIREETVKIAKDISAVDTAQEGKTVRHLAVGEKASGKSILMLQAMSMAYMNQWVVLNIPEGHELVNNTSSYAPLRQAQDGSSESEPRYIQPHLTQALLSRVALSNESVLRTLAFNHPIPESLPLKKSATLRDLVQLGADDFHHSWRVWNALFRELSVPGTNPRPRVLLTADGVDHWMGLSQYRNPEHKFIHAHQLALVKQFVDLLFSRSGASSFANGGMVFFTTSGSNTPAWPTFELLLSQMRASAAGDASASLSGFPLPKAFSKPDERVLALGTHSANVNLMDLKGLSVKESRGYLQYFAQSGLLTKQVTDGLVGELRGLSSGGLVGELAKLGRRVTA